MLMSMNIIDSIMLTLSWLRLQVQVPWSASVAADTSSLHSLLFPEKYHDDDGDADDDDDGI